MNLFGKRNKMPKSFNGLGCINCPNNKLKKDTFRDQIVISDHEDLDILFLITQDNEKLFDLIDEFFIRYKIGVSYLTKCDIDLELNKVPIECCKKQVTDELSNKIKSVKCVVVFDIAWFYSLKDNTTFWRNKYCPVKLNDKVVWNYTCLDYTQIDSKMKFQQDNYWKQLRSDFKNLDTFLSNYSEPFMPDAANYESGIKIISGMERGDLDKLKSELEYFKTLDHVAVDIENTPLKPWGENKIYPDNNTIVSIAIGTSSRTISFPIDHPKCWNYKNERSEVIDLLEDFLLNSGVKICHNLKHELHWFYWYFGKEVLFETKWADTQSLAYIIDHATEKGFFGMHGLGKLILQYFGFNLKSLKEIEFYTMLHSPVKDLLIYNARDTKWTHALYFKLISRLEDGQQWLFDFHNKDCITWAIAEAEGYKCDLNTLNGFKHDYENDLKIISDKILSLDRVPNNFDINSPKKLSEILIKKYNLDLPKSDKNQFITDKDVLNDLVKKHDNELAKLMLEYREKEKAISTYITGMAKNLHPDNRFHSEFNSLHSKTGRKTSNSPNAQNFPKRKLSKLRSYVVPEKNCVTIAVDYGQLEARGYCMASNETSYIEKIKNGEDIHMYWAKRILEYHPNAYTVIEEKDLYVYRSIVKNMMVFPSFYGAGIKSRAINLNVPLEVMIEIDNEFWSYFPMIKKWQEDTMKFYSENGYIKTLTNRRLTKGKFNNLILSKNDLCNYPIQGTCSDIVCDAANRLSELSYEIDEPGLHPTLNIHDDLTFMGIPKNKSDEFCEIIMKEMCRKTFDFIGDVPLQVELSVGDNWGNMVDKYVKDTRDFTYD